MPSSFFHKAAIFAALTFPAFVLWLIVQHAVGIPLLDVWDTPGRLFVIVDMGEFRIADLFAFHNEARKAFTSLIWMALHSPQWTPIIDYYASFAVSVFVAGAYLALVWHYANGRPQRSLAIVAGSAVIFASYGASSWLWGVNIENSLIQLLLCLYVYCVTRARQLTHVTIACIMINVCATFTFASGLAFWFICSPFVWLLARSRSLSTQWLPLAVYVVVAVSVIAFYFHDYPPIRASGQQYEVALLPVFLLAWLGAPFSFSTPMMAPFIGFLVVSLIVLIALGQWRSGQIRQALPVWALVAYGLAAGLLVSIGRAPQMGLDGAFADRYFQHVGCVYLGVFLLGLVGPPSLGPARLAARAGLGLGTAVALAVIVSQLVFMPRAKEIAEQRERRLSADHTAAVSVDVVKDNPGLQRLHPNIAHVESMIRVHTRTGRLALQLLPPIETALTKDDLPIEGFDLRLSDSARALEIRLAISPYSELNRYHYAAFLLSSASGGSVTAFATMKIADDAYLVEQPKERNLYLTMRRPFHYEHTLPLPDWSADTRLDQLSICLFDGRDWSCRPYR